MFFLRRLNLLLVTLVLTFGMWAGWHAASQGFTQSWRESIRREFEAQGIHLSLGRLTLDPFHGFVARDVRIYQDAERKDVYADISRIDLDVSIPSLFQKQFELRSLQIRDADATLPLDIGEDEPFPLVVSGCHARILFTPGEIEVKELRGEVFGIQVGIVGDLVRHTPGPGDDHKQDPDATATGIQPHQLQWLRRLATVMEAVSTDAAEPARLDIRALADLGDFENGVFEVSLRAPALHMAGHPVSDVAIHALYDSGTLTADTLRFRDSGGAFRAELDFVRESRALAFNLNSHAQAVEILRQLWWPEILPDLHFHDAPMVALGGRLVLPEGALSGGIRELQGLVTGNFALGSGSIGDVPLAYVSGSFSLEPERFFLRDLRLRTGTGDLRGDILAEDGVIHAQGLTSIHPEELVPLSPHHIATDVLDSFRCSSDTEIEMAFELAAPLGDHASEFTLESRFSARDLLFKGMPFETASARWTVKNNLHTFHQPDLMIAVGAPLPRRGGQTTTATRTTAETVALSAPNGRLLLEFEGLESRGWPVTALAAFAPQAAAALPAFRHSEAGELFVDGTLQTNLRDDTHLRMSFHSEGTFYWPLAGADLPLNSPESSMLLQNASLDIPRLRADLFGGRADARLRLDNLDANPSLTGSIALNDVTYSGLLGLVSEKERNDPGQVDLALSFHAPDMALETLSGSGEMRLRDGDLFSIPLFGPLSPLVEVVLPETGLGYSVASEAAATFDIRQGILSTDDFQATTPSFQMDTQGTVNLATRDINFTSRMNARGIARVATTVFSYIFEFKGEGTTDEPAWRTHRIPQLPLPLPGREGGAAPPREQEDAAGPEGMEGLEQEVPDPPRRAGQRPIQRSRM